MVLLPLPGLATSRPKPAKFAPHCAGDADCTARFPALDRSRCDPKGKRVVALDLNGDKQPDVWKLFVKVSGREVLCCKKLDLNFDGAVEITTHYDPKGTELIEELDLDFDGKVDLIKLRHRGRTIRHTVGPNTRCQPVDRRCVFSKP
jgi:hypothetical protein